MTPDQIATIAASVATCVTAVFILLTLLEMKTQRSVSSKPSLAPVRQSVNAYKLENNFVWSENLLKEEDPFAYIKDYPVRIYNLGNGAAKSIRLKWELETDSIIDTVNKLCQRNMSQIFIKLDESKWMSVSEGGSHKVLINTTLDMEETRDHLLPASIDKEGISVRMPKTFITLASYYFMEGGKSLGGDNANSTLNNKPEISLSIAYEDIAGKKHSTKFAFFLSLIMYSEKQFGGMLENETAT